MSSFERLISCIPADNFDRVEKYINHDIAFFRPDTYVVGVNAEMEDYHIVLPTSPIPSAIVDNKRYKISRNRLIILNPGSSIFLSDGKITANCYTSFSVRKEFLSKIAQEMGASKDIEFYKLDNPCSNIINQAVSNFWYEKTRFGNALMLDSIAIQLIVYLLRETESNCIKKLHSPDDSAHFVNEAEEYIRAFYHSNITIEDICKAVHVSPYHLIRTFKMKTGMTPHEYLLHVRIENAKHLLQNREYTVTQAAVMCGFSNISHFSSVFKRLTGVPPLEYKKIFLH